MEKRNGIPTKISNLLWAKSGGRCYMCNKLLYKDLLTKKNVNNAYIAHIIDVNQKTHRYDETLSPKLEKSIDNLMLLCDTHHRLIDNEGEAEFTIERLQTIKKNHEKRIERLTSILIDKQSFIIQYSAPIGKHVFMLSSQENENAMVLDGFYPAGDTPIDLSCPEIESTDSEDDFWGFHSKNLIRKYERLVGEKVKHKEITQVSIFAIAPQPLLILLGGLLGDIKTVYIYPKNREGISWGWRSKQNKNEFKIVPPQNIKPSADVALKISISANIHNDRIESIIGKDCAIWEITIPKCSNDFLKSPHQAKYFREAVKATFDDIKLAHGEHIIIHVFPAMPAALAVEFGKVRMPKADLPLIIYDQNRERSGFIETIRIPYISK